MWGVGVLAFALLVALPLAPAASAKGSVGNKRDVFGRDGGDEVIGFDRWDQLYGEQGNDVLRPGFGRNVVDAGPGNDLIRAGESDGDLD